MKIRKTDQELMKIIRERRTKLDKLQSLFNSKYYYDNPDNKDFKYIHDAIIETKNDLDKISRSINVSAFARSVNLMTYETKH